MARPFAQLPQILEKRQKQFERGVDIISRRAANAASVRAVNSTRVDTGKGRSNWLASTGVPLTIVIPPYAPGKKLGIGESGNARGAETQNRSIINSAWVPTKETVLYIANNVDYMFYRNFGLCSDGIPDNMLAKAVVAWREQILNTRKVFID